MDPINLLMFTFYPSPHGFVQWFSWAWLLMSLVTIVWWPLKFWRLFMRENDDGSTDSIQVWHLIAFVFSYTFMVSLPWFILIIKFFTWYIDTGWPKLRDGFIWLMNIEIIPSKEIQKDE
jgi:TRAP-type uncharacterized transport system fused permease subunit